MHRLPIVLAFIAIAAFAGYRAEAEDALDRLLNRDATEDTLWVVGFDHFDAKPTQGAASVEGGLLRVDSDESVEKRLVVGQVSVRAPLDLPIDRFRYLTVRARCLDGATYYIRPIGRDAAGDEVPLWYETAATDDRVSPDWETATFSLPLLAEECGTGAVSLTGVDLACADFAGKRARLEVDFVAVHQGLVPEPRVARETDFTNHLDDDGDGQTDSEEDAFRDGQPKWVLAYYHPWFGTPTGPSRRWSGWANKRILSSDLNTPSSEDPDAVLHDPEHVLPGTLGKRDIAAPYYPLDFARLPDYLPAEPLDYGECGGVARYDCADVGFAADQIRCAKRFGIEGFVVDTGGIGSYEDQLAALVRAAEQEGGFTVSAVYDWYYVCPNYGLTEAKSPEAMARDLFYLRHRFGDSPAWLRRDGKPVIFATFLSSCGVSLEHWRKAVALSASPDGPPVDGALPDVAGRTVDVALGFSKRIELPPGEGRPLTKPFAKVTYLDSLFRPVGTLDIGTPQARPALISGWSFDEGAGEGSFVWAASEGLTSVLRLDVPPDAAYAAIEGPNFAHDPADYEVVVDGNVCASGIGGRAGTHSCVLSTVERGASRLSTDRDRDYLLVLDSQYYGAVFDGYGTYAQSAVSPGCLVSPRPRLTGATALPGFDDTVIRNPGNRVDREGGMFLRRSFERALAVDPSFLSICTWSEWGEGTVIEPTVEFGYRYCEIALTYSLIYRGLMAVDGVPSERGLTVERYDPNGPDGIRVTCTAPVRVTFEGIGGRRQVAHGGAVAYHEAGPDGLVLDLSPGTTLVRGSAR